MFYPLLRVNDFRRLGLSCVSMLTVAIVLSACKLISPQGKEEVIERIVGEDAPSDGAKATPEIAAPPALIVTPGAAATPDVTVSPEAKAAAEAENLVLDSAKYEEWIANGGEEGGASAVPLADKGQKLYEVRGCVACHSNDGSRKVGPTWKGIFAAQRKLVDGTSVVADEKYLRQSILVPGAQVVAGYPNAMPSYQGQLNDKQIKSIIEYIKTLK